MNKTLSVFFLVVVYFFSLSSWPIGSSGLRQNGRYQVTFDPEAFLSACRAETPCSNVLLEDSTPTRSCWRTLFALRDHYRQTANPDMVAHTYHAIAKLLLSSQEQPISINVPERLRSLDVRARHISTLLDELGFHTIPEVKANKVKKWAHIYAALLRREWALHYSSNRLRQLKNAYAEIESAIALKTTKTTHLIAAQLIREDGYTPEGMTRDEALALADEHSRLAFTPTPKENDGELGIPRPPLPLIVKTARPPYLNELKGKAAFVVAEEPQERAFVTADINDPLQNFDFRNLAIGYHQAVNALPLRHASLNRRGVPQRVTINGQHYLRQDVDGDGMNCFFNAMGLTRDQEVAKLNHEQGNASIRYMIANEIVSAVLDPAQLGQEVRTAIRYAGYAAEQRAIQHLQRERNDALRDNPNAVLRPELSGARLHQSIIDNDRALRSRALSLGAFRAFLTLLSRPGIMMGFLSDMRDDMVNNLTAIDALGMINNIGIVVYGAQGNLIHQFVPTTATEVQYLYFHNNHFMAIYHENAQMLPDSNDNHDDDHSDDDIPTVSVLRERYPHVNLPKYQQKTHEDDVRTIMYLRCVKGLNHSEIAKKQAIDGRRVSEILLANNVRKHWVLPDEIRELFIASYLRAQPKITDGLLQKTELFRAVAKETNVSSSYLENFYYDLVKRRKKAVAPSKRDVELIATAYRSGESLTSLITRHANLDFLVLCRELGSVLGQEEIRGGHVTLPSNAINSEQKEALILNAFDDEKAKSNGKTTVSTIVSKLSAYKFNFDTVKRILAKNNRITNQLGTKHLPVEMVEKIHSAYKRQNPTRGTRAAIREQLSHKFGVSFGQVKDITRAITYQSTHTQSISQLRAKVSTAFYQLSATQKRTPIASIVRQFENEGIALNKGTARAHLIKLGLYHPQSKVDAARSKANKRTTPSDNSDDVSEEAEPRKLAKRVRKSS